MAVFPLVYGLYSLACYRSSTQKAWMLRTLIAANSFYALISLSLIVFLEGPKLWGYLFLGSELLVLAAVVMTEWTVYQKEFGKA